MSTEELLSIWINENIKGFPDENLLSITRAEPRFQTRNYFARFKIRIARLDGTGMTPTDIRCVVVEVSDTSQTATVAPATECDSIIDL